MQREQRPTTLADLVKLEQAIARPTTLADLVKLEHDENVVVAAAAVKAPPTNDDNDDASDASDSLVRIAHEQERARTVATRVATDQVSRFAAAHVAAVAAAAAVADGSESTLDRAANVARQAALPAVAHQTIVAAASPAMVHRPPPLVVGNVNDVLRGSGGAQPPLAMRDNYDALHRNMDAVLRAGNAPISGQAGMRIAEVASTLVREVPKRLAGMTLPRVLAATVSPLENTFLQRLVTDVVDEASMPPHLNDPQSAGVVRMRQALRVSPRRHEESMLRPPRAGEPACAMGSACKGNAIICDGGGMTLVAFFYEDELKKYEYDVRNGVPDARLPDNSRLCLLCLRYDANRHLVSMRTQNVQCLLDAVESVVLVQSHFNLVDVEGEYCLADCNAPVAPVFEGIMYPIVKPALMQFERHIDAKSGEIYYRQLFPRPGARPPSSSMVARANF